MAPPNGGAIFMSRNGLPPELGDRFPKLYTGALTAPASKEQAGAKYARLVGSVGKEKA
jgi:hypothetical protein